MNNYLYVCACVCAYVYGRACIRKRKLTDACAATAAPTTGDGGGVTANGARVLARSRSLPGAAGRVGRGISAPHGSSEYSERSGTVSALGSRREGRAALARLQRLARSPYSGASWCALSLVVSLVLSLSLSLSLPLSLSLSLSISFK